VILPLDELWIGDMVAVGGVLVVRLEDRVCAYVDRCAHLGVPMSEGTLEGNVLTCRAHHYQYDARTGQGLNPRGVALSPVACRVVDGSVVVGEP
jgi:toluene monooxygenase system ferredoxin subunit